MDKDDFLRGAAVFGSSYIKRWLEPRYDELMNLPYMARLRSANVGSKYAIEAILYALTALAEQRMSDNTPLGMMTKAVLMDAAPEIAARLLKDARADLGATATTSQQPEQSVASKILALDDKELLGLLLSIEAMDVSTKARFLNFAARASESDLRRFAFLTPENRSTILGMHGDTDSSGSASASFKTFISDFWSVAKAGGRKTAEVSLPVLSRYVGVVLQVLKTCGALLAMALVVCTIATLTGSWMLLVLVLGLLGASAGMVYFGKQTRKSWLSASGMVSASVMALLALVVAGGYPDAVFGIAAFFLVGLPTLAVIAVLIPATTAGEILKSMFPEVYQTLVRAFQMLVAAFFGLLLFSLLLLVFPPQNPVAFFFIIPAVLVTALIVGFGLTRISPEVFLKTPVILGLGATMLVSIGFMSMPNLRQSMRRLPATLDLTLVDAPTPVVFASSNDIDFVATKDGEVKIWYAEKTGGGYDLFRCEGVGPYYSKDGRRLAKADSENIRLKIAAWVDREAAAKADALRKAEVLEVERKAEEKVRADSDATQRVAQDRLAKEKQAEEQKLSEQRAADQRKAAQLLADKERRAGYLNARNLPSKVDFIVAAATPAKVPMESFATALVKHVVSRGKTASNIVFSPTFTTSGGFDSFFGGRGGSDLQDMPVSSMGTKLILARVNIESVKPGTTVVGLLTATVSVAFNVLSTSDGSVIDGLSMNAVGAGTTESGATSAALDRILEQLGQHGY